MEPGTMELVLSDISSNFSMDHPKDLFVTHMVLEICRNQFLQCQIVNPNAMNASGVLDSSDDGLLVCPEKGI
jgi:hypothetical protein